MNAPNTRTLSLTLEKEKLQYFASCLTLIRFKVLGQPVHHFVDCLVHCILLDDPSLIPPPFVLIIPREPTDRMIPIALKDIPSMQSSVIVHQQDIAGFHTEGGDMFFTGPFDFIAIFQGKRFHRVGVKDFGHADFGDAAGTAVSEFAGVVVGVVEPRDFACDGVAVDGGFGRFDCLQ
jgi:hypothetical protein